MDQRNSPDKQTQQYWRSRLAQERLSLSASVREALATPSLQNEAWEEESDELADSATVQSVRRPVLVPPKLSLQSKILPIVRPSEQSSRSTDAHQVSHLPQTAAAQRKQRSVGRTTKVRLQAAPHPDGTQKSAEINAVPPFPPPSSLSSVITATSVPIPTMGVPQGRITALGQGALSGTAVFERGQSDLALVNSYITSSSVILVMLTADPGPVVVQYVSLQPQIGFTVHLSAPTQARTPFNYVILLGELF